MKSYSGIPYTTGKQAADDVKTQLVGFIKIPKWLLGLCLITVFYILFVCFSMYKIGDSTTQLYEYPYTVSRKAQEMKTALYGMHDPPKVFAAEAKKRKIRVEIPYLGEIVKLSKRK